MEVVSDHVVGVVGERPHAVLRAGVHVRQDSPDILTNLSPLPTCTNFTHCQLEFVGRNRKLFRLSSSSGLTRSQAGDLLRS